MKQIQRKFNANSTPNHWRFLSLFMILVAMSLSTTSLAQIGDTKSDDDIGTINTGCVACSYHHYYSFKDAGVCAGDWWGVFIVTSENVRITINISTSNNNNYDIIGHASLGNPFYYYPDPSSGTGSRKLKITCYDTKGTSDPKDDVKIGECTFYKTLSLKYGAYANFKIKDNRGKELYKSRETGIGSTTVDNSFCYPENLFFHPSEPHPSVDCNNAIFYIDYVETDPDGFDIQIVGTEGVDLGQDGCPIPFKLENFNIALALVSPLNYLSVRFTTIYDGCTNSHEVRFKSWIGDGYPVNIWVSASQYNRRADYPGADALKWSLIADGYPYSVADYTIPATNGIILTGNNRITPIMEGFKSKDGINSFDITVYQYDFQGAPAEKILHKHFQNLASFDHTLFSLNSIQQLSDFFDVLEEGETPPNDFFKMATNSAYSGSPYYYNDVATRFYEVQVDINTS